jgi:lipopolysaccharide transport system permease protein
MTRLVIEANRPSLGYWADLYRYRELLYFLAWRDILVRYKQTAIGVAWAVIRPLLVMLVLWFVFGRLAGLPGGGTPYPIVVLAAVLPWQFFAVALGESSTSLVANAGLVSKVYFPRMLLPVGAVLVSLVDFAIYLSLLGVVMALLSYAPTWRILTLPLFTMLGLLVALGPGLLVTALNVRFRDFRYVIPFVVQFGLYVSPVGFRTEVVPEKWRLLFSLNPMVGVIDGFRWAICRDEALYLPGFFCSLAVTGIALILGVVYFRRTERTFADII